MHFSSNTLNTWAGTFSFAPSRHGVVFVARLVGIMTKRKTLKLLYASRQNASQFSL